MIQQIFTRQNRINQSDLALFLNTTQIHAQGWEGTHFRLERTFFNLLNTILLIPECSIKCFGFQHSTVWNTSKSYIIFLILNKKPFC